MDRKLKPIQQKIHLIISICIVIPISFVYGVNPASVFNIQLKTVDEHHFFKAVMGFYLGCAVLWVVGVFKQQYLKTALISNVVFMLGLGFGRILSYFLDGIPTIGFLIGTIGEFCLGFYGLWVLTYKKSNFAKN